ncbi:MAG: rRNA maturation RNase YbeY [Maritimibacter sp.]
MELDVIIEDERWAAAGLEALAQTACGAALAQCGVAAGELVVMGCDDARIAALNTEFRDKPTPTNVLSWPSQERAADAPGGAPSALLDVELGDIAISYDTCAREAAAAQISFSDHVVHLLVHGTLHLLGYDHIHEFDAALMEGVEVEILGKLGIKDPY